MLKIRKIEVPAAPRELVGVPAEPVACNNWAQEFPYAPKVTFAAAHNGTHLLLTFRVEEECTMAVVTEDNGPVWTDSAVEFFISFDDRGYYNFEFSCIGKALLGFRKTKPDVTHATPEVMASILRSSSLGDANFEERRGDNSWELNVAIPASAFFAHDFQSLDGVRARANVYKCGDNLSKPHFLSWQPIRTEKPNFHVPQFFGEVEFE
ncbi:carbohydrate-binding family 9-like protein [Millionella massiliensis]|uniref:carbohydrate-binding family 9-like protein n=1 Tax=Millionella massiliensis TaxID=1871023 RepID=UPI0023A79AC8|nr:carbohydrate-binding family 9-like protein [Millionella massiliensis]